MSDDINSIRAELWEKMHTKGKPYRDAFVAAHLSTNIAAQIQTLREREGWTQEQLAEKTGMSQARISVMENPSYDKYTLKTLRRIASVYDVALIVRFEAYSALVNWVSQLSSEKMAVPKFDDDFLIERKQESATIIGDESTQLVESPRPALGSSWATDSSRRSGSCRFNPGEQSSFYQQQEPQRGLVA
jgi:transcriptional regulator with XRE-family HTH domain